MEKGLAADRAAEAEPGTGTSEQSPMMFSPDAPPFDDPRVRRVIRPGDAPSPGVSPRDIVPPPPPALDLVPPPPPALLPPPAAPRAPTTTTDQDEGPLPARSVAASGTSRGPAALAPAGDAGSPAARVAGPIEPVAAPAETAVESVPEGTSIDRAQGEGAYVGPAVLDEPVERGGTGPPTLVVPSGGGVWMTAPDAAHGGPEPAATPDATDLQDVPPSRAWIKRVFTESNLAFQPVEIVEYENLSTGERVDRVPNDDKAFDSRKEYEDWRAEQEAKRAAADEKLKAEQEPPGVIEEGIL